MRTRPNRWVPTLSVVGVFVVAFALASLIPWGALSALAVSGVLFTLAELDGLDKDFREATRDIGFCAAAALMQMDPTDLARSLKGTGHRAFDLRRLEKLPIENQQEFYFLRAVRKGLPTRAKVAAKMTLAMPAVQEIA